MALIPSGVTLPPSRDTIASSDVGRAPCQITNTTALPSGVPIGQTWSISPRVESGTVNGVRSPPATLTRERPCAVVLAPITSSSLVVQSAPLLAAPSAIRTGALPSSRTFMSVPELFSNSIQRPSGENSAWLPLVVPGIG